MFLQELSNIDFCYWNFILLRIKFSSFLKYSSPGLKVQTVVLRWAYAFVLLGVHCLCTRPSIERRQSYREISFIAEVKRNIICLPSTDNMLFRIGQPFPHAKSRPDETTDFARINLKVTILGRL